MYIFNYSFICITTATVQREYCNTISFITIKFNSIWVFINLVLVFQSSTGGNNDGLTKQQLDLIHQIMEQTQRQSQPVSKSPSKTTSKPSSKSTKVQRVWSSNVSK